MLKLVTISLHAEYQRLVNDEGILVQLIELLNSNGEHEEANYLNEIKGFISIKRLHIKAQLKGIE